MEYARKLAQRGTPVIDLLRDVHPFERHD